MLHVGHHTLFIIRFHYYHSSIKSTKTETLKGEEKKETEEKTLNGNEEDIKVCKESNVPQEMKAQQSGLSDMQSKPMDSVVKDKEDISKPEDSKDNNSVHVLEKSTSVDTNKTDHGKMTNDSAASVQMLEESDKSTFLSSKTAQCSMYITQSNENNIQ